MAKKKMTVLDVLVKAREIISVKERWTKGYYAKNAEGAHVETRARGAVCFCSTGAIQKALPKRLDFSRESFVLRNGAADALEDVLHARGFMGKDGRKNIVMFNDDPRTKHRDVLRLFDAAIKNERQKQRRAKGAA